jgi:hypothetical protein
MSMDNKEYYMNYLSTIEQVFLKNTRPIMMDTTFANICFNESIRRTLTSLQDDNNYKLYFEVIGLIYLYE